MNSIFNPDHPDYLSAVKPEEENVGINYGDEKYQGKYVYLPKVGETAEFDIKELNEVKSNNPKFNFTENVPMMIDGEQAMDDDGELVFKKKDLGYHVEATLTNGKILHVGSIAAFINVLKKYNIIDGDHIRVAHPAKGEWKVEKL